MKKAAPRSVSVAPASASAAIRHIATPKGSAPPCNRAAMISATPPKPSASPATPSSGKRCRSTSQPKAATRSGIVEAMIAASEASIHCIATKFSPR